MQNDIYTVYHLTIDPADFEALAALIDELVPGAREEADTLTYEFSVNAAHTKVTIIEGYRTAGVVPHVTQTFAPYAKRFLKLVKIDQLYVYGKTTPEIRATLDGFDPIYMTTFAGFTR